MSSEKLRHEIDEGLVFWGYEEAGTLVAVMGLLPHRADRFRIRSVALNGAVKERGDKKIK
jgi:hypothetical protein